MAKIERSAMSNAEMAQFVAQKEELDRNEDLEDKEDMEDNKGF